VTSSSQVVDAPEQSQAYAALRPFASEHLDHRLVEQRNASRLTTAQAVAFAYAFQVYPLGTGIAHIVLDGVVAGHLPPGGDQQPGTTTDHRDGVARLIDVSREFLSLLQRKVLLNGRQLVLKTRPS
jgi:hypothetical protein